MELTGYKREKLLHQFPVTIYSIWIHLLPIRKKKWLASVTGHGLFWWPKTASTDSRWFRGLYDAKARLSAVIWNATIHHPIVRSGVRRVWDNWTDSGLQILILSSHPRGPLWRRQVGVLKPTVWFDMAESGTVLEFRWISALVGRPRPSHTQFFATFRVTPVRFLAQLLYRSRFGLCWRALPGGLLDLGF